jgi:hypothetical protein
MTSHCSEVATSIGLINSELRRTMVFEPAARVAATRHRHRQIVCQRPAKQAAEFTPGSVIFPTMIECVYHYFFSVLFLP